MKNLIVLFIGLATAFSFLNAQSNITLDLEEINSVGLSVNGTLTVSEGVTQRIRIEGPDRLIEDLNTEVKDGSWNIKYESFGKRQPDEEITIELQVKSLKELAVSGRGVIESKGRFSKVIKRSIAVSGTGSISFKGDAEDIHIALSGVGMIDVDCAADNIYVALSGSGDIILNGSANYIKMAASGTGHLGGENLKTKRCKAAISGSTILTAEVTDRLDLTVSGSGVFRYKGNPDINKKLTHKSSLKRI